MKLNTKLTLTTLCTALLPLVMAMTISLWRITVQFRGLTINSAQGYMQAGSEKLSGFFSERISEISAYANTPLVRTMDWQKIGPFLHAEVNRHNGSYEKLVLGNPDASCYVTSGGNPYYGGLASFDNADPKARLKSIGKRKYWQYLVNKNSRAEGRIFVSDPIISYTTGVRQVLVGATVLSETGKQVVGMVGGTIEWTVIENLLDEIRNDILEDFGHSARVFLLTHNGIYVYHWDPGKSIHLKLDPEGKPFLNEIGEKETVRIKITDETSKELAAAGIEMMQGKAGYNFFFDQTSDQEMVVIYAPVRSAEYAMAMIVPKAQIIAPVKSLPWFFIGIAGVTIILVMIAYFSVAKRVTRPIVSLNAAANDLAEGNWEARISLKGNDEVSALASAFNKMADALKKREQALRESEERFRSIFESTSDGILIWDMEFTCLFANRAAIDHLEITRDNLLGKTLHSVLIHMPDLLSIWGERIEEVFKNGKELRSEDTVFIGGKTVYHETILSSLKNAEGDTISVSLVYRDITERKEAEKNIIQNMKEISDANKRLEVLVANTTDREKRMMELKQEVNVLLATTGKEIKYSAPQEAQKMLKEFR